MSKTTLCKGIFRAFRLPKDEAILFAFGQHDTSGFKVEILPYRMPTTLMLMHEPTEIHDDASLSFVASYIWKIPHDVSYVLVIDSRGKHPVALEPAPELRICEGGEGASPPE
jgi:hypothetical protein